MRNAKKPHIEDRTTVVTSPHKVHGPDTNDLVLQLRKHGIGRVMLGGMSANLCVESHLRERLEQGFAVIVVQDASAAAVPPDLGDGYAAVVTSFTCLADAAVTTEDAIAAINAAEPPDTIGQSRQRRDRREAGPF